MNDTPRTEKAIASQLQHYSITSMVLADFARGLERELAAAHAAIAAIRIDLAIERAKVTGINATLDAVERIAGLHKTSDYAWRQLDAERAAREQAEKETKRIKEIGMDFQRQYNTTFEQSCKNLERAEVAEKELKLERSK